MNRFNIINYVLMNSYELGGYYSIIFNEVQTYACTVSTDSFLTIMDDIINGYLHLYSRTYDDIFY